MDSLERTRTALAHVEPDRIPVDFWATSGVRNMISTTLSTSFEDFLDVHDVDIRYIEGPGYKGPELKNASGEEIDIWGVTRSGVKLQRSEGSENYMEVTSYPLASAETVEEILNYPHWPSPDWFDYSVVRAQCEAVRAKKRAVAFMGDRLNRVAQLKPAMYLRGTEQILMDLAMNPDVARAVFARIAGFYMQYLERILDAADGMIDIVVTGDDFGSQNGLLVSPNMWDEFIAEGFANYLGLIHNHGSASMHHTCGSVYALVPRMIECGLDVLQSLQPEAADMEPERLKKEFGRNLCFQGGISIQKTLPFGNSRDIHEEVQRVAGALGPGGGYIFCTAHNLQIDTPVKNILALLEAYKTYGSYRGN